MTPEQFKKNRKDAGLSQRELAEAIGLGKNGDITLRRVEKGSTTRPPSNLLIRALELYYENRSLKKTLAKLIRACEK